MKKYLVSLLLLGSLLLNTGCVSTSRIVAQLKNDPATVDLVVSTVWGSVVFHRAFPTNYVQPAIVFGSPFPTNTVPVVK